MRRRQGSLVTIPRLAWMIALCGAVALTTTATANPTSSTPKLPELTAEAARPPVAMARARALRDAILLGDGWSALANAYQLDEPLAYLAPKDALRVYTLLAGTLQKGEPSEAQRLAAAYTTYRAWSYANQQGDAAQSKRHLDALGFVRDWHVIGPFENSNMSGLNTAYGPEGKLNHKATYPGKVGPVAWLPLDLYSGGYAWLSGAVTPSKSALAYALAYIEVPATTNRAVLRIGSDGAHKVWLNGALVGTQSSDQLARLDSDAYGVQLRKGKHVVLIKIATENRGRLGLLLRVTDENGAPIAVQTLDPTQIPAGTTLAQPNATLKAAFEALSPRDAAIRDAKAITGEARPRALMNAALITKKLRPRDPTSIWQDLAVEAIKASPSDAALLLDAVSTINNHWDRMPLIARAASLAQDDPWLLTKLAQEAAVGIGVGHVPGVLNLLERATTLGDTLGNVSGGPAVLPRLQRAQVMRQNGQHHQALALIEPLPKKYPNCIPLLVQTRGIYENLGHTLSAWNTTQSIAALRLADPDEISKVSQKWMRAAQPKKALKVLEQYLALNNVSFQPMLLKARALHQLGRNDDALAWLDQKLTKAPLQPQLLLEKAKLLEQVGNNDKAVESYELALSIQPENRSLLEKVQALKPKSISYETPYRWGQDKLEPAADAAERHVGQDYYYLGSQQVIHVSPSGQASRFTQDIIHVLTDEGARNWKGERIYYSPDEERVEIVSVRVRKADGSLSEAYTRNDYNAFEGPGNLYYQRQYAYIDVGALVPGDVVEYAYRVSDTGDNYREGYFGDLWYFDASVDVQHSSYVLLTPEEMTIHTHNPKLKKLKTNTSTTEIQGRRHTARVLEATEIPRVKVDKNQPGRSEVFDYVLISSYKTWDQVGKWWWNLIKDQLVVDANIKKIVADITKGLTDDREKVRAIHTWVVKNTRYVGIEFGVHGWKPYRTTLAVQRRFGDCKDKASLTKVMLETAGIEANMVLIRTRRLGAITDVPASLAIFDHAISYVPKFDLFLDGTAEFSGTQDLPIGDQGSLAVIVKDGGEVKVVRTPVDEPKINQHVRVLKVDLGSDPAVTKGELTAQGADAVYYRRRFDNKDKRLEVLGSMLARTFPGASLLDAKFVETSNIEKPINVTFNLQGGGFIKQIGDKQALFPGGREIRLLTQFAPQASRDQDLMLSVPPYTIKEKVIYKLSKGTTPASVPKDLSGSSTFGTYSVRYVYNAGVLETVVELTVATERINRKSYAAFRTWLQELDQAINQPVVIQNNE